MTFIHDDDEDSEQTIKFQHAKVHMPIVSIKYMVRRGCAVKFVLGGGEIHFADGKVLPFVERQGVFFIGLNVKRPEGDEEVGSDTSMQGFSRPAA